MIIILLQFQFLNNKYDITKIGMTNGIIIKIETVQKTEKKNSKSLQPIVPHAVRRKLLSCIEAT